MIRPVREIVHGRRPDCIVSLTELSAVEQVVRPVEIDAIPEDVGFNVRYIFVAGQNRIHDLLFHRILHPILYLL